MKIESSQQIELTSDPRPGRRGGSIVFMIGYGLRATPDQRAQLGDGVQWRPQVALSKQIMSKSIEKLHLMVLLVYSNGFYVINV